MLQSNDQDADARVPIVPETDTIARITEEKDGLRFNFESKSRSLAR